MHFQDPEVVFEIVAFNAFVGLVWFTRLEIALQGLQQLVDSIRVGLNELPQLVFDFFVPALGEVHAVREHSEKVVLEDPRDVLEIDLVVV